MCSCANNKCGQICNDRKYRAIIACISLLIMLLSLIVITLVLPIEKVYIFEVNGKIVTYTFLGSLITMSLTTLLLLWGLLVKNRWLLLAWIIVMVVFWNFHLGIGIVTVVHCVVKTTNESVLDASLGLVILITLQVFWLFIIAIIWGYWTKLTNISNIQSLLEYIIKTSLEQRDNQNLSQ